MAHRDSHPSPVDGCFGCKVATLSIASAALPNRGKAVTAINDREARWQRDMPAYKRLRQDGLQPVQIDGAAYAEQTATERHHIEGGVPQ